MAILKFSKLPNSILVLFYVYEGDCHAAQALREKILDQLAHWLTQPYTATVALPSDIYRHLTNPLNWQLLPTIISCLKSFSPVIKLDLWLLHQTPICSKLCFALYFYYMQYY